MAKRSDKQLSRQIGEHLVVAKLGRLGYRATPFAGSVPGFDVLATDDKGRSIPIQVKTIKTGDWSFDAGSFLDIEVDENGWQHVNGKKTQPAMQNLIYVLVLLRDDEDDKYFVLRFNTLQEYFFRTYKGGRRPRNPKSFHCRIRLRNFEESEVLKGSRDNWDLIMQTFETILERAES